jgi:hypothetical protein
VAQVWYLRGRARLEAWAPDRVLAGYKPALQQIENLRYAQANVEKELQRVQI